MTDQAKRAKMRDGQGFIAALDQSGGSTPKALGQYGISADAFSNDEEMFDLIHQMRSRIIKSPAFNGDKVVGAILFEMTMDRDIDGIPTAQYLWEERGVVPFLKVDKGLADAAHGVKLMNPIPNLDTLCERAASHGIFGTKMRSVIDGADQQGIRANVTQQFQFAEQIMRHGLMPILEPEVTINIADKQDAEDMLRDELLSGLDALPQDQQIMLKLTLPENPNHYKPLVDHPKVMRVVALSGGYTQAQANDALAQNAGVIASFSRALAEGLSAQQSDQEFDDMLKSSIDSIHAASVT